MPASTLDATLRHNARVRPRAVACVLVPDAREKNGNVKCFFTWDELHAAADTLAHVLRTVRDRRVLSFCCDGVEALVALFACARARKSLVNVDATTTPASRIRDVAEDANATTCLCANDVDEDRVKAILGERGVAVRVRAVIDVGADTTAVDGDAREDDEIWVAYTSGTTGKCKGAAATHRRAMAYARVKCEVEGIDTYSRVCLASNATFDLWHGDACTAATVGAAVVVAARATFQYDFARILRDGEVTHVCCTPTMFSLAKLPRGIADAPTLRCVSLAGERMREGTITLWADDVALYNVYGATESTVVQTYARMRNVEGEITSRVGKPYKGFASVFIVDEMSEDGLAVQSFVKRRGVEGEIAIGGVCVADGYLNDLERTARAFVQSPSGTVYLTGDRGFIDASGDLHLCGRLDRQVKIRGHRVELDEIEAALRSCPTLCDDAVVFYDAVEGALTSHARAASPTFDAARDADLYAFALEHVVEQRLPRHMVPHRHVFIERARWPLTSSGKTNRQMLLQWLASGETTTFRPKRETPRAGLETIVANAWATALGHSDAREIGALDAFDALGGTSLNVLAVSRALASADGIIRSRDDTGEVVRDTQIGLRDGEAAAVLDDGDEPAACAFDMIGGPFAPCEIFARPVLRDYVDYLREQGIDADAADTGDSRASIASGMTCKTSATRCMLAACGRGVAPVVRALLTTGVEATGEHLRTAAASRADEAVDIVRDLLAAGVNASSSSVFAGTLATHIAAARGNAEMLEMLIAAGAPAGAKDADKQTICHLAVRSGDTSTVRVAANACKYLKTRKGGLEAWDRWKRTPAAWALIAGSSEILAALRDAGANLTSLETDVSNAWVHGSLSAKSEVQFAHRPFRKRDAEMRVLSALVSRLDVANVESERVEAATAIRELLCANAENREKVRAMGAVPKLCELVRVHHCVEAIGALRNIAANTSAASAAGAAGAMEILADVIRSRAKVEESRLNAEDKRVVYATASAMRALTVKHDANAEILRSLQDVADIVSQFCEGMRIE